MEDDLTRAETARQGGGSSTHFSAAVIITLFLVLAFAFFRSGWCFRSPAHSGRSSAMTRRSMPGFFLLAVADAGFLPMPGKRVMTRPVRARLVVAIGICCLFASASGADNSTNGTDCAQCEDLCRFDPINREAAVKKPSAGSFCVFLHGAGTHSTAADSGEDDTSYWGGTAKLIQNTPACAERVLWHQDTRTRRWDDSELMEAACSAATTFSVDDKTITNTTVYAHSVS